MTIVSYTQYFCCILKLYIKLKLFDKVYNAIKNLFIYDPLNKNYYFDD